MTTAELPTDARPAIDEIRQIGGDELVREMVSTFLRFARARVPHLQDAAETGDLEAGATIAHTLMSSARQLGALALGDACASAELAALGGDAAGFVTQAEDAARAFKSARAWMDQIATA